MKKPHLSSFGSHSLLPAIAVTGISLVFFLVLSVASTPPDPGGHRGANGAVTVR